MNKEERRLVADGLKDVANLAAGALIFGQSLTGRTVSVSLIVWGVMLWMTMFVATRVMRWKG